mgnify:FL=1
MRVCILCKQAGLEPFLFPTKGSKRNHQRVCPLRPISGKVELVEVDPEGDEREDPVLEDQLARWGMGIGRKYLYLHPILDTRITVCASKISYNYRENSPGFISQPSTLVALGSLEDMGQGVVEVKEVRELEGAEAGAVAKIGVLDGERRELWQQMEEKSEQLSETREELEKAQTLSSR